MVRIQYEQLIAASQELSVLESTAQLLQWNQQTYMPAGAAEGRSDQTALLARMIHDQRRYGS